MEPESKIRRLKEFDVFLAHNSADKRVVKRLARRLAKTDLKVWLDSWELRPGSVWQDEIQEVLGRVRAALILVGSQGIGPWELPEIRGLLSEFVDRRATIIPVLLPGAPEEVELPLFLKQFTWQDLRGGLSKDGIASLYWGITGHQLGAEATSDRTSEAPEETPTTTADGSSADEAREEVILPRPQSDRSHSRGGIAMALGALALAVAGGLWLRDAPSEERHEPAAHASELGQITVVNKSMIRLGAPPFNGAVAIYIADISRGKPIDIRTFLVGPEQRRWRTGDQILLHEIDGAVEPARRLFAGRVEPDTVMWKFDFDNRSYVVKGEVDFRTLGSDRLSLRVTPLLGRSET